jgi:shikimate kinase
MEIHLSLIGPRCVGKTNTGLYLAEAIGGVLINTDSLIETRGKPIKQIVEESGWEYFRNLEADKISAVTSNGYRRNIVLALGGGAVAHEYDSLRELNVNNLRRFGPVILLMPSESLEESAHIISERMSRDVKSASQRPSLTNLAPEQEVLEILKKRMPFYMAAAHSVIYTNGDNEQKVAERIMHQLQFSQLT